MAMPHRYIRMARHQLKERWEPASDEVEVEELEKKDIGGRSRGRRHQWRKWRKKTSVEEAEEEDIRSLTRRGDQCGGWPITGTDSPIWFSLNQVKRWLLCLSLLPVSAAEKSATQGISSSNCPPRRTEHPLLPTILLPLVLRPPCSTDVAWNPVQLYPLISGLGYSIWHNQSQGIFGCALSWS